MSSAVSPLRTLIHPDRVKTNNCTDLLKVLAFAFMFVDHAGKMLFPQYPVMRLIGRLAFPIFAYNTAMGAVHTRDGVRYLSRVVLLALISQPLYAIALGHENAAMYSVPFWGNPLLSAYTFYKNSWQTPSILLSLSLALTILICLRNRRYVLALGAYVLCVRFAANLDYGIAGIQLILLFYLLCEHPLLALLGTGVFMLWWAQGTGYTVLGHPFGMRICALPAVVFCCLPLRAKSRRMPRWLTYGFYPAHLLLLALLTKGVLPF